MSDRDFVLAEQLRRAMCCGVRCVRLNDCVRGMKRYVDPIKLQCIMSIIKDHEQIVKEKWERK